ncbi:WbuC family cupin fold metalloprotein [Dongshaea marina]|uniref:WbuC family cupin fold metalloprotein n=1 Tax=Dongshaea marina TaxID=2047966 RepID=UPI000D3ED908|nr:WbuC family cupin fold metalloprotein [Dongshaea marina]
MNQPIDRALFNSLEEQAQASERKRMNHNFHQSPDDPVQRMLLSFAPGTYIPPHHHPEPNKWEMLVVLSGALEVLLFDESGALSERITLKAGGECSGIEMKPGQWHSMYPVGECATVLELKPGPFVPATPAHFSNWAPEPGSEQVEEFMSWMSTAQPGERWSR